MRTLFWFILLSALAPGCADDKAVIAPAPRPVVPPPTPAPPTPAPSHASPAPERPTKRVPPPVLSPQVTSDQEQKLTREAQARISGVEEAVAGIDADRLAAQDREMLGTIHSFLVKAKAALSEKDFPRALNLAEKAKVLADELPGADGAR